MSKAKTDSNRPQYYEEPKPINAWFLYVPPETFSVTVPYDAAPVGCQTDDAILFTDRERKTFLGVRRVCLAHDEIAPDGSRLLRFDFDRAVDFETPVSAEKVFKPNLFYTDLERLKCVGVDELNAVLRAAGAPDYSDLPRFDEDRYGQKTLDETECRARVRDLFCRIVELNLLGPAGGEKESIVDQRVRDRYLIGRLAPHDSTVDPDSEPNQVEDDGEEYENDSADVQESEELFDDARDFSKGYDDDRDREEDTVGSAIRASLTPSSIGMTFCVGTDVSEIEISASWGAYERVFREGWRSYAEDGPKYCWLRSPQGGKIRLPIPKRGGELGERPVEKERPKIVVNGRVTEPLPNGLRLVSVFLLNRQEPLKTEKDRNWIFQAKLTARGVGGAPIFQSRSLALRPDGAQVRDAEEEELDMIYRDHYEFAVGHNVSVHAVPSPETPERAVEISTSFLPSCDLPTTESRDAGALDMRWLAVTDENKLFSKLDEFERDYLGWIEEKALEIDDPKSRLRGAGHDFKASADEVVARCREAHKRIVEGIATLRENPEALRAFRFMNGVMADQRVHTLYAAARAKEFAGGKRNRERRAGVQVEDFDKSDNHRWRPFQLAFILISLPSLADPRRPDRSEVHGAADLLWFPTGGGKTEAYLGLAAFAMAIRRRQGALGGLDADRGLTVVMRYTLRLLTLQQFQRAATLICAMEVKRRESPDIWGKTPFTLGLWVGQKTTPNKTEQSESAIKSARNGRSYGSTPAQLPRCPWCGGEIEPGRDIKVDRDALRTVLKCGCPYGDCDFASEKAGLPVVVVDEEIYRRPPSMLIATVDKFAKIAWENASRTLFGRVERECPRHGLCWPGCDCNQSHNAGQKKGLESAKVYPVKAIRPPDLIIQDEFHLISGPLGTIVGLYESAIDELCSWELDGRKIRPKIVASTATTRRAKEQCDRVFEREVKIFPPNGLDASDNYFSKRQTGENRSGRRYVGICSPGTTQQTAAVRVYAHLVTCARFLFNRFGKFADPYMTLVGYFSSLRELGGARRIVEDNVRTLASKVEFSPHDPYPGLARRYLWGAIEELTSRVASADVPDKLESLALEFNPDLEPHVPQDAVDVVLATNMLSVGVDVQRLGLMLVYNQPKNSAEYIQATSRVGRKYPGLVFTLFSWGRPRDFSHYESFEQYHATFYKFVEAQSVTPFAPRALDRGLTGVMVGLLRVAEEKLSDNEAAGKMRDHEIRSRAEELLVPIGDRAERVAGAPRGDYARALVGQRLDEWEKAANDQNARLGYERTQHSGDLKGLVHKPGVKPWDSGTVGLSMREVEPELGLILDKSDDVEERPWSMNSKKTDSSSAKEYAQGGSENV